MGRGRIHRRIRWYVGSLMGDTHYRRYLEYRRRTHPGEPVITDVAATTTQITVTFPSPQQGFVLAF